MLAIIPTIFAVALATAAIPFQEAFVTRLNFVRSQIGVPPLTLSSHLNPIAQEHAQKMARITRVIRAGSSVLQYRFSEANLVPESIGEAVTVTRIPNAVRAIIEMGKGGPLISKDMYSASFNQAGVGMAERDGQFYWALVVAKMPRTPGGNSLTETLLNNQ